MQRFRFSEIHMGVRVTLTCWGEEAECEAACRAAFARFEELDQVFSDYRATSELMEFCGRAGKGPVELSAELFAVLERGQELAELSDGAIDVTCGPLSRLWREARSTGSWPSEESVRRAADLTGYRCLSLDRALSTGELGRPGMLLDLGGIAKGYACDAALSVLTSGGIGSAMVEAGGDIALGEPPPDKDGWHIDVQGKVEALSRCGISTSGDAEQHLDRDGKRYSHLIDPRTGWPLVDSLPVTVIAAEAFTSDGLSKVCAVTGLEASRELLVRCGAEARVAWLGKNS